MNTIRTFDFKIMDPNEGKKTALNRTLHQFRRAVNFYLHRIGEDPDRISNKNMPDVYERAKEVYPDMNTALLQQAGRFAIEQYKSYDENDDNPHFPHCDSIVPVRYDNRSMTVYGTDDGEFDLWISLATLEGRVSLPINGADGQIEEWETNNFDFKDARLQKRDDGFYVIVHVETRAEIPDEEELDHFIGVDMGLNNLATIVVQDRDGNVLETELFDGSYVAEKRRQFRDKRREYGEKKLWSKLKDTKGQERRFMKDQNHKISRRIVDIANQYDNAVIVMEKLDGIRENVRGSRNHNRKLHNWTFGELKQFIEYKGHADGVAFRNVPAYKTSQVCTDCGGAIRRCSSYAVAVCEACKKEVNADVLGATNLVRRLFFYREDSTGPRESGPSESDLMDRGHDDPEACSAVGEVLSEHELRKSAPRSLLQTA
jgi:IS605 OrfB family transposase